MQASHHPCWGAWVWATAAYPHVYVTLCRFLASYSSRGSQSLTRGGWFSGLFGAGTPRSTSSWRNEATPCSLSRMRKVEKWRSSQSVRQVAVFTRVRVQACYQNMRCSHTKELLQVVVENPADTLNAITSAGIGDIF